MASELQKSLGYFGVLPNELVIKVMSWLTLSERLCFMRAFPKFKDFGQTSSLKRRVMTSSDIYLDSGDLKKLIDPEQAAFELSLSHVGYVDYTKTILGITNLMNNLQELTLKNCRLNPLCCMCTCGCLTDQSSYAQWVFFECPAVRELAKIKVIKFEFCDSLIGPTEAMKCWGQFFKMLRKFNNNNTSEVIFTNMFTISEFIHLLSMIQNDKKVEFENLRREWLSMDDPLITSAEFVACKLYVKLGVFLRVLSDCTLGHPWPFMETYAYGNDPPNKLLRVTVKARKDDEGGAEIMNVRVTEAFPMYTFRMDVKSVAQRCLQFW